jgi:hypothetical protein
MSKNRARVLLMAASMSILVMPVFAQHSRDPATAQYGPCSAANGGGPNSTSYYGEVNPCAFTYNVPEDREIRLLNENPQCTMYSRTVVNCSKALTGNYGQIQLDRRDVARAGGGGDPGSAAQLSNPSAPPPNGVPAAQRGTAEQLRQRAFSLIDRNDYRDGNYLRKLRDEETARSTANANATLGHAGSGAYQEYFNHNSDYWRQRSWEERPH